MTPEQYEIRNSPEFISFILEEWNYKKNVIRLSRVATRYWGFKISMDYVKRVLRRNGVQHKRHLNKTKYPLS